jgi:hypothetical protein
MDAAARTPTRQSPQRCYFRGVYPALRLALLALLAAAAGGAVACTSASVVDEDATNGIYGSWVSADAADASTMGARTVRLSLTSARTYSLEELTVSTGGATLAHVETGTFTASAGVIDWRPAQSTCPGPDATYQSAYELSGTTFSLALPGDVVALRSVADDDDADAGAALTLGCFGADGGFTTSPLSAVSTERGAASEAFSLRREAREPRRRDLHRLGVVVHQHEATLVARRRLAGGAAAGEVVEHHVARP